MKLTQNIYISRLLLYIGIFIALNLVAYNWYARLDFTGDKRYTLSEVTKENLAALDAPVTVEVYASEGIPEQYIQIKTEFEDLLTEYANRSNNRVLFSQIDPSKDEALKQKLHQQGIPPRTVQIIEKDRAENMLVYLGAIIKRGAQQEVIPFLPIAAQVSSLEYELTKAIRKLSSTEKVKIGLVQGHGEPDLQAIFQAVGELSALYEVDTLSLRGQGWTKFKTLILLAPKDSFSRAELQNLDLFVKSGGRLMVGINAVSADLQNATGAKLSTGLEGWLASKGVMVEQSFLTDTRCGQIQVQRQMGGFSIPTAVAFRFFPVSNQFADHPVSSGLESVQFIFASPLSVMNTDSSVRSGTLVYSSEQSGKVPAPTRFDINAEMNRSTWTKSHFLNSNQSLAVYLEGKLGGETRSKMIVVGDGDFAVNQGKNPLPANNVNLLVNAIDWLTDDTGLIALRSKKVQSRPIKDEYMGDDNASKRNTFKIIVVFMPLLILLIFGIVRRQKKLSRRSKWSETDYS